MAEHQYRILGRIPPTRRPTEQENRFIKLYDDTGLKLVFEDKDDLFIMVEDKEYRRMIDNWWIWISPSLPHDVTVELEVPWSIGLPPGEQQLPLSFQHALCIQVCPYFSRSSASPGPGDLELCDFNKTCRPGSDNKDWRNRMTARGYDTVVPIFREPKVETVWEKIGVEESWIDSSMEIQHWQLMMFCANCRAACSVIGCTHFQKAPELFTYKREQIVEKGQQSDFDVRFSRYPPSYTDHILSQDVVMENDHELMKLWMELGGELSRWRPDKRRSRSSN